MAPGSPNAAWADEAFRGYADHMDTVAHLTEGSLSPHEPSPALVVEGGAISYPEPQTSLDV